MAGLRSRSRETGMTLVELLVASTLFGLLLLLLAPAWGGLLRETRLLTTRASLLSETQVARAFLLADAIEAKSVSCRGQDVVDLSMDKVGGLPRSIEYRFRDGSLYRWEWPPGTEMLAARGLDDLDCDPGGGNETLIVLASGGAATPYRLHVLVSDAPKGGKPKDDKGPPNTPSAEASP